MSESVVSSQGDSGGAVSAAPTTASPSVAPVQSAPSDASPTETPQADGATSSTTQARGPIPYDRHEAILKSEREKRAALAWAEKYQSRQVEEMASWYDFADKNPVEFLRRFQAGLSQHPVYGQAFNRPAQNQPAEPEPDLVAENGQPVYSAPQLKKWQEWNQRQLEAKFQSTIAPLLNDRQQAQAKSEAEAYTKRWLEELGDLEGFNELKPEIAKRLREDRRISPLTAYKRAYAEVYKPKQKTAERAALVDEMNTKAQAATANPSTQTTSPTNFKEKPWEEVLAHFAKTGKR